MTTPGLGTLGLKFVGFLGLLIVFVCLSNWINTKVAPAHPNSLANLFGAAALLAGWLAWQSVMYRTGSISKRRKRSSNQPKKRPCCALNRARKIWRSRLHNLFMRRRPRCQDCQRIVEPGDRVGQSEQVKRMSRLLHQVLRPEIIIPLMDELETDDRAPLFMVIGQMQGALAMSELGSDVVLSDANIAAVWSAFTAISPCSMPTLARVYARDSRPPYK
jgi:hypothetical protein